MTLKYAAIEKLQDTDVEDMHKMTTEIERQKTCSSVGCI